MKKFFIGFVFGLALIGGTIAATHYLADSAEVAAEPTGR
jgi:hypothetical protein